jgi:hypothetical protein
MSHPEHTKAICAEEAVNASKSFARLLISHRASSIDTGSAKGQRMKMETVHRHGSQLDMVGLAILD